VSHYSFEALAERILPVDRNTLHKERKGREARSEKGLRLLKGEKTGNLRTFSGRQLSWDRLEDLRTLSRLRSWPETGIPHGYRSKYLHWCLNFLLLSGAVHSRQLFHEAQALAREVCPDFTKDLRSVLSTLYRKAQAYEAGEKVEFEGRKYPPLYTPRNSTLIRLFGVTDDEMRQLGTIVTEEEARSRDATRHRQRRREVGTVDRASYLDTAEQRRAQARLLRAMGLSIRAIAKEMGLPPSTVQYYLE
jgi:hypothetical protein